MDPSQYSQTTGLPLGISSSALIAAVIWSAVGMGYFVFGKKQRSMPAFAGGVGLIGISYFINSALWMSVAAVGIIAGVWYWARYHD